MKVLKMAVAGLMLMVWGAMAQKQPAEWDNPAADGWPAVFRRVEIASSRDGVKQPAMLLPAPAGAATVPVVISLHTWGGSYKQRDKLAPYIQQAGWLYLRPHFRGPNDNPEACLSPQALSDIDDAIDFALKQPGADATRLFVVGASGGGMATLGAYLNTRHKVALFLSWVPISDLEAWHNECMAAKRPGYAKNIARSTSSDGVFNVAEARRRSPLYMEGPRLAQGPLEIFTGINDGHTGSVPVSHALHFFNRMARQYDCKQALISASEIEALLQRKATPEPELGLIEGRKIFLRRTIPGVTVTVFDGKHEMLVQDCFQRMAAAARQASLIEVDATRTLGELKPFWASQIIHPTESLRQESGKALLRTMAETGAACDFVRIYNQPEEALRIAADGNISYDWGHFDEMADTIIATGNKLKVVFFAMPLELALHTNSFRVRPNGARVCTSPPRDYGQWQALCADFAQHVIARYGLPRVREWTFRCWNEPDGGFWYKGDLAAYLKLYDHFAAGIKGVSEELKIGGPGLTCACNLERYRKSLYFFEHVARGTNRVTQSRGSPIDFIAMHAYGGHGGAGGGGRAHPSIDYMLDLQLNCARMRDSFPELRGLPIHVEEWGETTLGGRGIDVKPQYAIRNHEYSAAFLVAWVARHMRLRQERDLKIESFTFCASGYEKPTTTDFAGLRTLHTRSGFEKALLNGYRMLHKMVGETIPCSVTGGQVDAFASRDQKSVRLILVNYQSDALENEGAQAEITLRLKTPWKDATALQASHWRIDRNHSNACTLFEEMGRPEELTGAEIDDIKSRMGLELLEPQQQVSAGSLAEMRLNLPCNGVSLLEWRELQHFAKP